MSILALARPEIVALKPYSHASWDPAFDRLHANELPWRAETDRSLSGLNRYPEPHPHELAARLAGLYGVAPAQLLPGRGSDESIDLVVRGLLSRRHRQRDHLSAHLRHVLGGRTHPGRRSA